MRAWSKRSPDEANLLNPAFLSMIVYQCVRGYCETSDSAAPYVLPFLVCPLVLPKNTRESLPKTVGTLFTRWITRPQGTIAKTSYVQRASALRPYIREALMFSIASGIVALEDDCSFRPGKKITSKLQKNAQFTSEVIECFDKAHFCGRWLARAGKIETVMALMGVKP